MWAHISRFILRYKLFLLISLLFFTIFMANKALQVQYSYEFLPLLPEDDPIYIEYQEFLGHFGQEGNVMVVGFQCDSLYQLENYNAYYDLYGQLKEIEGVEQVVSILQARNMKKGRLFLFLPRAPRGPRAAAAAALLFHPLCHPRWLLLLRCCRGVR